MGAQPGHRARPTSLPALWTFKAVLLKPVYWLIRSEGCVRALNGMQARPTHLEAAMLRWWPGWLLWLPPHRRWTATAWSSKSRC